MAIFHQVYLQNPSRLIVGAYKHTEITPVNQIIFQTFITDFPLVYLDFQ